MAIVGGLLLVLEHVVVAVLVIVIIGIVQREGIQGFLRRLVTTLRLIPGVNSLIVILLKREVGNFVNQLGKSSSGTLTCGKTLAIPLKGVKASELSEELKELKKKDVDPSTGKVFAYVYTRDTAAFKIAQDMCDKYDNDASECHGLQEAIVKEFFNSFLHENALNPMVFPSLLKFETETVAMTANMLHGDGDVVGSLTSGGTESILTAVKTYRDRAASLFPHIKHPEMVAPVTIHPAFAKASQYFQVKLVHVPIGKDKKPNMVDYRKAITPDTILLLASAPEYSHGVMDPIEDISNVAVEMGLPFHVDSCIGGFMLPWVEKAGYKIPKFDFRIPGVTSISADIHKYGLGIKGASVVVYRNDQIRRYQVFAYTDWPGGLFGSIGMAGSRPGGTIAASWATLKAVGQEGYLKMAKDLMEVTEFLVDNINAIEGLRIAGRPCMTLFAFESTEAAVDLNAVADEMEKRGWKMERQFGTIHCTILPHHTLERCKQLVDDLKATVVTVRGDPSLAKTGTAAMYGMVGKIPDKGIVSDFVVEFFNSVYKLK